MSIAPATMTTEEMLALPDDGTDRELIRGELREKPMTMRRYEHGAVVMKIGQLLVKLARRPSPSPAAEISGGEAGFRLRRNPDSSVGIDVAYVSADQVASKPPASAFFEGPPILAVEILSPSDQQDEIAEKVELYLETGVAVVWIVSPRFRTVTVHRPGAEPEMFNALQELAAEPHLPGFRVAVARLFGS